MKNREMTDTDSEFEFGIETIFTSAGNQTFRECFQLLEIIKACISNTVQNGITVPEHYFNFSAMRTFIFTCWECEN